MQLFWLCAQVLIADIRSANGLRRLCHPMRPHLGVWNAKHRAALVCLRPREGSAQCIRSRTLSNEVL